MNATYLDIIPTFQILKASDIELASQAFAQKSFVKNDCIEFPGSTAQKIYFLRSGLVYSQTAAGKINWYEFEGQSFADIESIFFHQPCTHYIRCAEDSEVVWTTKRNLMQLVTTNHRWALWYASFLEEIIRRLHSYYQGLLVQDASQRYRELIALHPGILQRIPLGHIASYLGISQVSLSRIRAGKQKK